MKLPLLLKTHWPTIAVCLVALAMALVFTNGMAPSFDSVRYANVAHWITDGDGIATSLTVVPVQDGGIATEKGLRPFTIQPPGLPLYYTATGVDNRAGSHRVLHIVSLVGLAWLVMALARILSGRADVGVAAALLTVLSPAVLLTTATFWTDLPTIALLLGALYFMIRSRDSGDRSWAWLLGASLLAAVAVSFRLTALAFSIVLLTDFVLSRRMKWREQLIRAVASSGVFGTVALSILLRNKILAGSWPGTLQSVSPLMPDYSLQRGWAYLGSRLAQSLAPSWAFDSVAAKLTAANATPNVWQLPGLVLLSLAGAAGGLLYLRRDKNKPSGSPSRSSEGVAGALTIALFVATLIVLVVPLGNHSEFHVVELRYMAALLPLVWICIMIVVMGGKKRPAGRVLAAILIIVFAVGIPSRYQPYDHGHEYMRTGLNWLKQSIEPETVILSNGGKVLLDEDLTRRVFHISDWHFRHALAPELHEEAGLLHYLRQRNISFVVLFGQPNRRMAGYWGRPVIGLFLEQIWQPWLVYNDKNMKVYRIPPVGPPPAQQ